MTTNTKVHHARALAAALAITATLALAGCGSMSADAKPESNGCPAYGDGFHTCTVTLPDTRRVTCVILDPGSNGQALSCDWVHADGSDRME